MTKQKYSSFWRKLYGRLNNKRAFRFAKWWFYLLVFLAIFSNYIANDIPLYCQYNGQSQFPIFQKTLSVVGYSTSFNKMTDWDDPAFTSKVYPIIPYHSTTIDSDNNMYQSPFGEQKIKSNRYRHWLGTDRIGRDVLAGLINGARVSIIVSFLGMGLASLIGLFLGGLSGYFGDRKLKTSLVRLLLFLGLVVLSFWLVYVLPIFLSENGNRKYGFLIVIIILLFFFILQKIFQKRPLKNSKTTIPIDSLTLRSLEIFSAIPKMLLVLVMGAILPPSLLVIALIIGVTHWPIVTRFTRSEMMKIRDKEYIHSAQIQNIPKYKILFRYALPNAIGPVLIIIMLGLGDAILAEAFLSFLGLGLPDDVVSWGKYLAASRTHVSAWWLALFPGLGIFITIYAANKIGELLTMEMRQD